MLKKALTLVALVSMFAMLAWADAWDKKTILTVKEPIQVPGAVLQPGTYVIKLVESLADRHIVRITNEREDGVIATFLAIPNYRLKRTGDSAFQFWETPAGNPKALRAWFYPGDNFGQEIAYPSGLSVKIAQYATEPVPSVNTTNEVELPMAPITTAVRPVVVAEVPKMTPPAPVGAAPVAAAPVVAAPLTAEPKASRTAEQADRKELPATASPLPALALAGLLALAAGFALRRVAA
jgi:hypothetical protein